MIKSNVGHIATHTMKSAPNKAFLITLGICLIPFFMNVTEDDWGAFCKFMKDNTWLAILLSALLGSLLASMTIRYNRRTARENNALDFDRHYKTSEQINDAWNTIATYIRSIGDSRLREIANTREAELFGDDEDIYYSLRFIFNEWERAGNAMNHNLYDEDFLYKAHSGNVVRLYDLAFPFIEERQKKDNRIYINFVALAMRWKLRRSVEEGVGITRYHEAKRHSQALKAVLKNL